MENDEVRLYSIAVLYTIICSLCADQMSISNFVLSWFSLMEIVHDDNCSSAESASLENGWSSGYLPILKKRLGVFYQC